MYTEKILYKNLLCMTVIVIIRCNDKLNCDDNRESHIVIFDVYKYIHISI